jgi:hypothetical protein
VAAVGANLLCSLTLALSEGLTFALIFQAASLLSSGGSPAAPALPGPLAPLVSSLAIPASSTVALVGESGGGKSSLVVLLVGLISPSQGWILADGLELEQIELDSWQRAIGVVSQDVLLLIGSIRENIAVSLPEAGDRASGAAAAAAFIEALPEGFGTLIGERGFRLSGGRSSGARIEALLNHVAVNSLQARREAVEFKQVPGSSVAANPERLGEGAVGQQLLKTARQSLWVAGGYQVARLPVCDDLRKTATAARDHGYAVHLGLGGDHAEGFLPQRGNTDDPGGANHGKCGLR